ncbi:haloacid dehalogenase-like hydrolase [Halosquirtibacter laminarini]|uniref:Haloacid dehalogenase-like hydrolase n=1 Tax=Halosquirtibacter laminarini TaxID=3374600 RepID=A0AC61NJ07_9BACT|nr:haloacid dehalogenase-like hydrolase [Prolixibacteraceae bacterium]
MKKINLFGILTLLLFFSCQVKESPKQDEIKDVLTSWKDGEHKEQIISFVKDVTTPGSDYYVQPEDRIAVFDNDGTLWCEKPLYSHFFGLFSEIEKRIKEDPSVAKKEPYKSLHKFIQSQKMEDLEFFIKEYKEGKILDVVGQLMGTAYSGLTVEDYKNLNRDFFKQWKNPKLNKTIFEMTYQPMKELIAYLKQNDFKVYIFTADEGDFLKIFSKELYGISPSHVYGTSTKLMYKDGLIYRTDKGEYVNNWDGKPRLIERSLGKRPIFAAGNSNGDFHMLQYISKGKGKRLSMMIHHTDERREFKYDSHTDKVLPYGKKNGYVIVDMKNDWTTVFGK